MTQTTASRQLRRRWPSDCLRGVLPAALAVCAIALIQCDRAPAQQTNRPTTSVELAEDHSDFNRDGVADMGYIKPGSTHELSYRLQAPADTAITELHLESDCPCVQAIDLPARVEAGESVTVRLQFKAPEKVMHYQQGLAIVAAVSGERTETFLTIDARLGLPLHISPDAVRCPAGGATTHRVLIRNDGPEPVGLIYALSDHPGVKLAVPRDEIGPGQAVELTLTTATTFPRGQPAAVRIKTTHIEQPEVVVRVVSEQQ